MQDYKSYKCMNLSYSNLKITHFRLLFSIFLISRGLKMWINFSQLWLNTTSGRGSMGFEVQRCACTTDPVCSIPDPSPCSCLSVTQSQRSSCSCCCAPCRRTSTLNTWSLTLIQPDHPQWRGLAMGMETTNTRVEDYGSSSSGSVASL